MTEGRVAPQQAGVISAAIARAVHNHFGRVTCGDMWLYMAIAFVESGFRSNIINYKNCWGIFQVHGPSWAHKFGMNQRDLLDPHKNADAGVRVFKYYLERHGSMIPALSAYNSDHPSAATRYARAVLYTRFRIKQRYTKLYWSSREVENIAVYAFTL
jgi:soluble lytic murein transglycosylase-like protein